MHRRNYFLLSMTSQMGNEAITICNTVNSVKKQRKHASSHSQAHDQEKYQKVVSH